MKNWNRLLALFLVFSVMSLVGCFLNDDDDDTYAGALTGAIKVSAVADAGAGTFAAAVRESVSPELRAAVAAKFEARVKIGGGRPRSFAVERSDDGKKLTLSQTIDAVAAGKQQVTIEIVAKGAAETADPILKTIETATVAAGQTNENDIKDVLVTVETTAKAIAFEAWAGKDTKTIYDFAPAQADLTALATKIQTQVTAQIADPKSDYVIPAEIKTEAQSTADKVVVNDTTLDQVKASVDTYLRNSIKMWCNTITPDERTALGNVMADDFIGSGLTKAEYIAHIAQTPEEITFNSLEQTLVKVADDLYKVDIKLTFIEGGITKTVNSATDGFAFAGSAPTTFTANSLNPQFQDYPVLVKKIDGSWKIFGNRSKLGYVDLHIHYLNQGGQTGTNMWGNFEAGKSFAIQSGSLSGANIDGTINIGKASNESSWHLWDGRMSSSYPFNNALWPTSINHSAGNKYTLTVTFTDNTTQTFNLTVPSVAGLAAPTTNTVSSSVVGSNLVLSWPQNTVSGFENYEILIWLNGNVYTNRIENANTTSIQIPFQGKDIDGKDYTLMPGHQYWISVNAFVGGGSFAYGSGSNVTLQETPTTPPVSSQRFSGDYRLFHYNASTQNRWSGMSEVVVNNGQITDTVKLDPDPSEINSIANYAVSETAGALVFAGQPYKRGAVSASGDIAMMHDWKSDDPMVSIFVKKPTNASNASLNGTYRIYDVADEVGANYVPQKATVQMYIMTFDGQGNYTRINDFDPDSVWEREGVSSPHSGQYNVTSDGKVTLSDSPGDHDFGQVSPDGNVYVHVSFAGDYVGMAVGVKQNSSLTTSSMNGNWVYACVNAGTGTPYSFTDGQLVNFSNGEGTWTGGVSDVASEIPVNTTRNAAVGSNGVLVIPNAYGSLSGSSDLMVTVSTDGTSRHFSLLVKK